MMKKSLVVLAINLCLATPAAFAGAMAGGASEFTQILNNIELIIQSIQDQARNFQLVQQTYLQQLQQLSKTIGPYTAPFQKALAAYKSVQNAQGALERMQGNVENLGDVLNARFQEYSSSNLSFKDWMAREQRRISSGDKAAQAEIISNRQVFESTQTSLEAYNQAAAAMDQTTGTHQATRMLGSQLTLLGGDLNKLVAITAQANMLKGDQMQQEAAQQAQTISTSNALKMDMDKNKAANQKFIDTLLNYGKGQ